MTNVADLAETKNRILRDGILREVALINGQIAARLGTLWTGHPEFRAIMIKAIADIEMGLSLLLEVENIRS